ncbi:hypothetical protein [Pseudomonas aeruginosa]|uniref:hypothetical protein n=1 Tax=Pseudomonas aeruginosa TaxID=287 RepID=UPI003D2C1D89
MNEQKTLDALPASHKEALALLSDGLCRIRETAIDAPEHAGQVAIALHNIPSCLAGEDRGGEQYLSELIEKGRSLVDDESWRQSAYKRPLVVNRQEANLFSRPTSISIYFALMVLGVLTFPAANAMLSPLRATLHVAITLGVAFWCARSTLLYLRPSPKKG